VLIELLKVSTLGPEQLLARIEFQGDERARQAYSAGRGVIFFTGHFGYWELCDIVHAVRVAPIGVLARPLDNPHLNALLERVRQATGNTVVYRRGAIRRVLRLLAANQGVAMLIDQHTYPPDAVSVDFFDRPAATTSSLAAIALRTGAPAIPVFAIPLPRGRYRMIYERPVEMPSPEDPDAIRVFTQRCTDVLEMYVRRYPELWLWMHRRWRDGGPGEGVGLTGELGERMRRSLGSGFIVDRGGTIVTNAHLLGKDREIRVRLEEGAELAARVVGEDSATDLAVLAIQPPPGARLVPLRFGDSAELQVGEWVIALGNPFGLGVTASAGVVSARPRPDLPRGEAGYHAFIQTDADINPGNSGGPLCNTAGEVVGVSSAVTAEGSRTGFAVPSALVQKILPALRREGKVVRAWVGIYMDRVTPEVAERAGLKKPAGALVRSVVPASPADRAGLRAGDIILSFEDREVTDVGELPWRAALAGVNRIIPLRVWRDRKTLRFSLRTERMPE
jgi:S1-C subfamily serine protease